MAASDSAGDQTVWTDATEFLSEVCRELDAGELVHGENFSLFESMSALEIMDPKMDGGMNIGGPRSVDEAISMGMAPSDLTTPQIIDVMDHIFSCEASWHGGHSLAQTVFSNIYMLKLECATSMPLLYSFCKLTRVTCKMVRNTVFQAHTHEEEDIFAMAFGLPLDMDDSDCLAVMNAAEEAYSKKVRKLKLATDVQQEQEEQLYSCILSRLRFRKALYHALIHMEKPQGRGLETARRHLSTALAELSAVESSAEFLASQFDGEKSETTASRRRAFGFDENLNRTLLPPTPPRSMKLQEWSEALNRFRRLIRDLDRVCLVPLSRDLESLQELIVNFQKSNPDLVPRAHMQMLVLQGGKLFGLWTMSDVLYKSIYSQDTPGPSQSTPLGKFLHQAGWLVISLLRMLCAHPAWQCRKLGKALEDWSNLFQQVEHLEDSREAPAINWLASQCSWMAFRYLWLGFELELYSSEEYCMVYWYLDHVLLTLLHYKLEREENTQSNNTQSQNSQSQNAQKKKLKKKKDIVKPAKAPAKGSSIHPKFILMQCFSDLCKTNIWLLAAFKKDGQLDQRAREFTTEQERYLQRFELLNKILVPCPLSFQNFREATAFQHYSSAADLYRLCYEHLTSIESTLQGLIPRARDTELIQEIRQLLGDVVVRNRIALQVIGRAGAGDGLKFSFEFLHHPCFGVVVVKNK